MSRDKRKVLVIGLEGVSFNTLTSLVREGNMPTIAGFLENGCYGKLKSIIPPSPAPSWASLISGKNPGKHGVYDFLVFENNSYARKVIDSSWLKTPVLWDYLGENAKKIIVMNVPLTYPPRKVNGILVSGMLTPLGRIFTYPPYLSKELYHQDYMVDIVSEVVSPSEEYSKLVSTMVSRRFEAFHKLLSQYDWDFAMVVFTGGARIQEVFWDKKDLINKIYIQLDEVVGNLTKTVGEQTIKIVVSCYGYAEVSKKFFVNEWLSELGLLRKKFRIGKSSLSQLGDFAFGEWNQEQQGLLTSPWFKRVVVKRLFPREHLLIDWPQSKAYFYSRHSQAININLKGREPQGAVASKTEFEKLRNLIIGELYKLRDPHTFDTIIEKVYKAEDLYSGPYTCRAPDIIFVPKDYTYSLEPDKKVTKPVISNARDSTPVYSCHAPDGFLLATGPEIRSGQIPSLQIYDLAPTILHLLGVPVPADLEGQVRKELFLEHSNFA